ncbi:MAG: DNA mismatch repair endonuclease MutL [Candidatus Omnitrophica bacterium]|nr:DNA mismatch repair endonuclease MutL [Candidatus Omnitrophota bacterium]
MSKVHILPPEIVSKIAAGEVVERPASVLKELLENSLDAGACSIEVLLKGAGKNLIEIKDNGEGISKEDIENIFIRHATSKISTIDDLYNISSLGFRGEALYSIAAISDVTLRSKTQGQDCGWEIHLRDNTKTSAKPLGMHVGTEIQVQELFFNTPARKKFLKSNSSELNHCLDIFLPYTLLHPDKRFILTHESRKLIDLSPTGEQLSRIGEALNLNKKDFLEDTSEFPELNAKIHLVLGDINIQRTHKDMQFIFINGRPVNERAISFHMNEIFRLIFSPGVYPFFCVFITMPADQLDVNVHPAKREVKIKDEFRLLGILRQFTEHLLMTKSKPRQAEGSVFSTPENILSQPSNWQAPTFHHGEKPEQQNGLSISDNILLFKTDDIFTRKKSDLKEKLKSSRYLGNLLKKYLIFESDDSLLLIDQHAAQERITFEKLKDQIDKSNVEVVQLLAPVLIKLSPQELVFWEENKEILEKAGFSTTLFDQDTLALHSHPQLISQPESSVRNLLTGEDIARLDPETLARMACRSSVMAGFAMNKEQAEFQRQALLKCVDPFICSHGRPTVIEILEETLQKQFLRK